jgi:RNA polymerase sigma-70 factor (ECF subfamily)
VPEPVEASGRESALAESLAQAFLLLLERLTPDERAAFLLRTLFDYEYAEIGNVVGRSEAAVRQIVSRARRRLRLEGGQRFHASGARAGALAERFMAACLAGNVKTVERMLTEGVEVHSDGGGKASAARVVVRGRERAARFLAGVFSNKRADCEMNATTVNGEPGVVFRYGGAVVQVVALSIEGGVRAVYMTNTRTSCPSGRWRRSNRLRHANSPQPGETNEEGSW